MGSRLRTIREPVLAGAPAGVRIRTRIHPTAGEAETLTAIGELLGSVYRGELAGRLRLGCLDHKGHALWRAQRKQALTAVSSSRWAGAITRAVEDQYQLGMRGLAAWVGDLRAAIEVLEQRCALQPGELAPPDGGGGTSPRRRSRRVRGYRSAAERFTKTRRLAMLRTRLARAEEALAAGRPSITVGGKRLWRNRNHLDAAHLSEQLWRDRWQANRSFLTADGESGKAGGNETIRVDEACRLRIKVPAALAGDLGSHLEITAPVQFSHRTDEWWARMSARRAVRYDISYDPGRGRWYMDASWATNAALVPELDDLRAAPVLGVDLPIRPPSPPIMGRRPRSGDVASAWRSGDGRQDPAPDSGRVRALHRPGPSTSPAPHHDGAVVPAHHHAHNHDEACRSAGQHPPPAANTVRAAQDSLLLSNQER